MGAAPFALGVQSHPRVPKGREGPGHLASRAHRPTGMLLRTDTYRTRAPVHANAGTGESGMKLRYPAISVLLVVAALGCGVPTSSAESEGAATALGPLSRWTSATSGAAPSGMYFGGGEG